MVVHSCILLMRSGNNFYNHKGGFGPLVYEETSPTQTTFNMETLFVFKRKRNARRCKERVEVASSDEKRGVSND